MEADSNAGDISVIEKHIGYILPLMEHYIETFPTYTLHNSQHICNLINIIGKLLGNQVNKLSSLEAGILILSTVYHDFGMIFTETERENIQLEEDFNNEFLEKKHGARVKFEESNKIVTEELAEWYCRWAHSIRVWKKLEEIEQKCGPLTWKGIPIKTQVGNVCESHNEPVENIRINDERFKPDFLGICDLRFCALVLRVADILDFDNTRSPQSVYDFLELGNPKNSLEKVSKEEWNKHMSSFGFQFPEKPTTNPLLFTASPPHPFVEQGIRKFLDLIDLELGATEKVLRLCSKKWKEFPFPENIDRSNIVSNNYLSGKYRFSLSEDKILDLLTGEDLYGNDFIFIRELIQNAIDTVRHRTFIEKIKSADFIPSPIEISYFKDSEGYFWIRIDDEGMGMNQEIIEKHLLNKGNSYYNSDLFKLEKIKIKDSNEEDFVPISRFGIGLLSCFLSCDKIEISSCYNYKEPDTKRQKNRLSIEGRSGFWIIRSEKLHHTAEKMPSKDGWENGFRIKPGTSIACRIKTSKEFHGLNMEDQIEQFLLGPEIPVVFNSKVIGGNKKELAEVPWCEYSKTPLAQEFLDRCNSLLKEKVKSIDIEVLPIDLSKQSSSNNLSGQLVFVIPRIAINSPDKYFDTGHFFKLVHDIKTTKIICEISETNEKGQKISKREELDISELIEPIQFPEEFIEKHIPHLKFRNPRISHNGITLYDSYDQFSFELNEFDKYRWFFGGRSNFYLSTGLLWFKDSLLPDVTVSRNIIKNISDVIAAHVLFATRELNEYTNSNQKIFTHLPNLPRKSNLIFTVETIELTKLYENNRSYWHSLPCIFIEEKGLSTIEEGIILSKERNTFKFQLQRFQNEFIGQFTQYVIERNFQIKYFESPPEGFYLQAKFSESEIIPDRNLISYQPMTFLDCDNLEKLILKTNSLNKQHPFAKWLIKWSPIITKEYTYFSEQLHYELFTPGQIKNRVSAVNEIIDRLRELLPDEAKPSKDLNINENSFYNGSEYF